MGSEKGTTFPATINQTICNALIDIGASRSCISETFYKQLNLPPAQDLLRVHVRSATGGSLSPIGTTQCTFKLGEKEFTYTFIVYRHLLRPMIIRADFLRQKHIFVGYSELGKCVLEYKHLELVSAVTVEESPQLLLANSVRISKQSLVILNTRCMATNDYVGELYKVRTNHIIQNNFPNLTLLSTIHRIDELVSTEIPLVAIYIGINDIWLAKETIMAHLDIEEVDISEVTTQTAYNSGYNSDSSEGEEDNLKEPILSSFITPPTDIVTHRKVELKDKEINQKYRDQFEELCERYKDIFLVDSTDIGKTPLLQMEIETGNSPPICQKPYTLALKYAERVKQELAILEEARVIQQSVSLWASPIIIVPK